MALFTVADHKIYSKYYGVPNFWELEQYWGDFLIIYNEHLIPLPVVSNETTIKEISQMLVCPPGNCGECCKAYKYVRVTDDDLRRLAISGIDINTIECEIAPDGFNSMKRQGDKCQFLKDNICSVYNARPTICRTYPIQSEVSARRLDGQQVEQIHIRVKCQSSVNVIRQVITKALKVNPNLVLLPDLTVIWRQNGN